jgi:hypothetical protein
MCDFTVSCKGCLKNIPALAQTMPSGWITVGCPLCHGQYRYLPTDIFRGRLSEKIAARVRKNAVGPWPPGKVIHLIAARVHERIEILKRVGESGHAATIYELGVVLDLLQRGERYVVEQQKQLTRTQG